jgi:MFS family permease
MVHSVIFVHAVPALNDAGISMEKAAFSIGLLSFVSVAGRLSFGYLGDFMDKRYLFMVSYTLMGVGALILLNARTMPVVYVFIALFGVGFGGNVPLMPAIRAEYFGRAAFGKIQGFMSPVTMIAGAIGPILAGYFFDKTGSYQISFLFAGLLPFAAAVAVFFARPTEHPPEDSFT